MADEPQDQDPAAQSSGSVKEPEPKTQEQELILGRFKTEDELANAYRELEKAYTQSQQYLSEVQRRTQELTKQQKEPEADASEQFWQDPTGSIEKIISKRFEPLIQGQYESQKASMRTDPEFLKYEPHIDQIVNMYPNLKEQAGIVPQLYKMVKGLFFDEADFERRVREKIKMESVNKMGASLESGGAPPNMPAIKYELTPDEKKVALKFHQGIAPDEAYKKYAEAKARMEAA